MVDINRHKFLLVQILKDIYTDIELSNWLGFKGGSALMFFYDLPRFLILIRKILSIKKSAGSFLNMEEYLISLKSSMAL
jgi:hypothetical protein